MSDSIGRQYQQEHEPIDKRAFSWRTMISAVIGTATITSAILYTIVLTPEQSKAAGAKDESSKLEKTIQEQKESIKSLEAEKTNLNETIKGLKKQIKDFTDEKKKEELVPLEPTWFSNDKAFHILNDKVVIKVNFDVLTQTAKFRVDIYELENYIPIELKLGERKTFEYNNSIYGISLLDFSTNEKNQDVISVSVIKLEDKIQQ